MILGNWLASLARLGPLTENPGYAPEWMEVNQGLKYSDILAVAPNLC